MSGCFLVVFSFFVPRLILIGTVLFTDWIDQAYETAIWPFLGWFFMPLTTLAYMGAMLHGGVEGGWMIACMLAIIVDVMRCMDASITINKELANDVS